jgi:hypothetical protein
MIRYIWLTVPQQTRCYVYRTGVRYLPSSYCLTPNVQRLPFGLVLKHGLPSENEAAALRMVFRHTTVSAPSVVDFIASGQHNYLLMTEITGKTLETVFNSLSDLEISWLVQDLKCIISDLRSNPSKGIICGAAGWDSPCFDFRLPDDRCGPFGNESLFNNYLVSRLHEDERSHFIPASNHSYSSRIAT